MMGAAFNGPGDQTNTDPVLGPLQDNGGPTLTHALLPGSPAVNAGDPAFTPPLFSTSAALVSSCKKRSHRTLAHSRCNLVLPIATPTPTASPTPHTCSDRDSDARLLPLQYQQRLHPRRLHLQPLSTYCYGYGDSYLNSYSYIYSVGDTATTPAPRPATKRRGCAKSRASPRAARKLKNLD